MAEVTIPPSLEILLAAIAQLDVSEKHQLWQYLDSELFGDEIVAAGSLRMPPSSKFAGVNLRSS